MTEPHTDSARDGRRIRSTLIAGAVALAVVIGGLGVAGAQTTTTTEKRPEGGQQRGDRGERGEKRERGGLHGEDVTPAPGGGYQTIGHQGGEVTRVSESSITVRSDDDFTRTYAVTDDTLVTAGNSGIADVKQGDIVEVRALVRGDKALALAIHDLTQIERVRAKYGPGDERDGGHRRMGPDREPGPGDPGPR